MREILFRGKRLDNGDWVYGYYCSEFNVLEGKREHFILDPNDSSCKFSVNPTTVGQYTGLKDKNEQKIFEGDLVMYVNGSIREVQWSDGQARYSAITTYGVLYPIVDSIYGNPEVLKEV